MSSQQLIANELLAFIQHAIDTMDEVSIMQICKSNFKEEDVSSGKRLLFQTLGKMDQMPSRRRDGTEKSVQDIITLLKVTDPDDVPAFVAKDLHKLPPVTFDHVDVTRLLKDITALKAGLAEVKVKLEVSENTICELRAEVVLLRNANSSGRTPDTSNVNSCREATQNASISSLKSVSAVASPAANIACGAKCDTAVPASTCVEASNRVGTLTPKRAYAAIAATKKPSVVTRQEDQARKQRVSKIDTDKDGFVKVEKKKRKPPCRNQCGTALTGPNMLLRPAIPTTQLYVSRLHHTTKTEDIVEYILKKVNWTLRVEKLVPRSSTNFNSFVVRVPTHAIDRFLEEEFWPKGVVYRRFRGRLHNTARCNTTPIKCV